MILSFCLFNFVKVMCTANSGCSSTLNEISNAYHNSIRSYSIEISFAEIFESISSLKKGMHDSRLNHQKYVRIVLVSRRLWFDLDSTFQYWCYRICIVSSIHTDTNIIVVNDSCCIPDLYPEQVNIGA